MNPINYETVKNELNQYTKQGRAIYLAGYKAGNLAGYEEGYEKCKKLTLEVMGRKNG